METPDIEVQLPVSPEQAQLVRESGTQAMPLHEAEIVAAREKAALSE